jgi:pimeloyl-ACP methyl ester carboxylesterase
MPTLELQEGKIDYQDRGTGQTLFFVHGLMNDWRHWQHVIEKLEGRGYRCVAPTLPMGSHKHAMAADADLTPPGMASIIARTIRELDLQDAIIVANDSGGAISQITLTEHPDLIEDGHVAGLVLTPCDAFNVFPPFPYNIGVKTARIPGLRNLTFPLMKLKSVRRLAFAPISELPYNDDLIKSWLQPSFDDNAIARDGVKFYAGMDKRHTLKAANKLPQLTIPTLMIWPRRNRFFKFALAEKLASTIPDARIHEADGGQTYIAIDRPDEVAEAVVEFSRQLTRAPESSLTYQ